jgi:hypothetical protein
MAVTGGMEKPISDLDVAWGYTGERPRNLAYAILMDYFGDVARASALEQAFLERVIAIIAMDAAWTLSRQEVKAEVDRLLLHPKKRGKIRC